MQTNSHVVSVPQIGPCFPLRLILTVLYCAWQLLSYSPPFLAQPKLVTDPGICTCCSLCLKLSASRVSRHVLHYQAGFSGCLILDPSSPSLPVRLLVSSAALLTLGTHLHSYLFPFLCPLTSTRIADVQEQRPSTSCPQLSFQCQCLAH